MSYTNSSLVSVTKISPNKTLNRNHAIDTITIHCVAGQMSAAGLGDWFARSSTAASSNYGIGYDGKIGLYVEEKDRSWCSSSSSNDNRAVTIEVASDSSAPFNVRSAAYESLIKLVADICKRNGIKRLIWRNNKNYIGQPAKQNMTVHKWFANKDCPGQYLLSHHTDIMTKVNAIIADGHIEYGYVGEDVKKMQKSLIANGFACGDDGADGDYLGQTMNAVKAWQKAHGYTQNGIMTVKMLSELHGEKQETANKETVQNELSKNNVQQDTSYRVKVISPRLRIRKGPGTDFVEVGITGRGIFTIVETATGKGSDNGWGKLKSGAGWISLDYTTKI